MIQTFLITGVSLGLFGLAWFYVHDLDKKKGKRVEEVARWAIHTTDFKFLIESYLDSLKYDSMDAKEIRRELLEQIKKVCPDWGCDSIIIHDRE